MMTDKIVRFRELYAIPSGNGLSRPSSVRGAGYRMINMGELFAHDIIGDIEMERVQMNDKEKQKFFVEEEDLLFARQSLVAAGAGKCSIVKTMSEPTTYESHLIRVRLNRQTCSPWFYYYLFRLPDNPVKSIVNQCAQAGIRGSDLAKVKVPFPPLPTQRKIAKVLSAYDDLIENNTKRIRILERMAEELCRQMFLAEPKPVRIGEVLELLSGFAFKSSSFTEEGQYKIVTIKNVKDITVDGDMNGIVGVPKQMPAHCYVKPGDILLSLTGNVGRASIAIADMCLLNQRVAKVQSEHKWFAYLFLHSKVALSLMNNMANGVAQQNLSPIKFCDKTFCFPSHKVRCEIDSIVAPLFKQVINLSQQNALLARQRDLLLPRLMSGKLSVEGVG